jgi:hypothetical protein
MFDARFIASTMGLLLFLGRKKQDHHEEQQSDCKEQPDQDARTMYIRSDNQKGRA